MSIWLDAAKRGQWFSDHTDRLTELTEAIKQADLTDGAQPKVENCQYRQCVSTAGLPKSIGRHDAFNRVPSVLSVRQYEQWTGKQYRPAAIEAGVTAAFEEYEASDDPHSPAAWS